MTDARRPVEPLPERRRPVPGSGRPLRRRAPVPVSGAVEALARTLEPLTPLAVLQRAWDDAVGPVFAANAKPVSERGGVLTVQCSGATWAQELTLMAPAVIAELNTRVETVEVTELRCTAAPPRRRS